MESSREKSRTIILVDKSTFKSRKSKRNEKIVPIPTPDYKLQITQAENIPAEMFDFFQYRNVKSIISELSCIDREIQARSSELENYISCCRKHLDTGFQEWARNYFAQGGSSDTLQYINKVTAYLKELELIRSSEMVRQIKTEIDGLLTKKANIKAELDKLAKTNIRLA